MSDKRTGKRVKFERATAMDVEKSLDELFQTFYEAKVAQGISARTLDKTLTAKQTTPSEALFYENSHIDTVT